MEVIILGAGAPGHSGAHDSQTHLSMHDTVLSLQHKILLENNLTNLTYLCSYDPSGFKPLINLNFQYLAGWSDKSIIESFLKVNIPSGSELLILYSDIVFESSVISDILASEADMTLGVVSPPVLRGEEYLEKYSSQLELINSFDGQGSHELQFSGLVKFSFDKFIEARGLAQSGQYHRLSEVLNELCKIDQGVSYISVDDRWSEVNSTAAMTKFLIGTKAETLRNLCKLVINSKIDPGEIIVYSEWLLNKTKILQNVISNLSSEKLVVRSSASNEDGWNFSNAGGNLSVLNVTATDQSEIEVAVNKVFDSYAEVCSPMQQVFVQKQIKDVVMSGVIFTRGLQNNSPYYTISYDDISNLTTTVTDGSTNDLKTLKILKSSEQALNGVDGRVQKVIRAVDEIENILGYDRLDIEFCITSDETVHILQVRPLVLSDSHNKNFVFDLENELNLTVELLKRKCNRDIQRYKLPSLYSNMADWNPAEILGNHPKVMSVSLYNAIICEDTWAIQRQQYGGNDVRGDGLLHMIAGRPFINVLQSITSFIPNGLPVDIKDCLVKQYADYLKLHPYLHDKIESEVVFTCWRPDIFSLFNKRFVENNLNVEAQETYFDLLKSNTIKAICSLTEHSHKVQELGSWRKKQIQHTSFNSQVKMIIDDINEHGTLPFAHCARAGFIAINFLDYLLENGFISREQKANFLNEIPNVTTHFNKDLAAYFDGKINLQMMLEKYGHLRPETYNVEAISYRENPEFFFQKSNVELLHMEKNDGHDEPILRAIEDNLSASLGLPAEEILDYIKAGVMQREYSKLKFTKELDFLIDTIKNYAVENGITIDELAHLSIRNLLDFEDGILSINELKSLSGLQSEKFEFEKIIEVPDVITEPTDLFSHLLITSKPNFVGLNSVKAEVCVLRNGADDVNITGKAVYLDNADPGYDWIFTRAPAALITRYGGANSHMAIRCAELGITAAIGIGYDPLEKHVSDLLVAEIEPSRSKIEFVLK
jgi:glutamine kinase